MMISTRGRYALRFMIDLAEHTTDGYIPLKFVAERQKISIKYLERILPLLTKNGLVEGVHGKGGGYRLTKAPCEYRAGDILRITEGDLIPVSCKDCSGQDCPLRAECRTKPMWDELEFLINNFLDGVTLDKLMKKAE